MIGKLKIFFLVVPLGVLIVFVNSGCASEEYYYEDYKGESYEDYQAGQEWWYSLSPGEREELIEQAERESELEDSYNSQEDEYYSDVQSRQGSPF
ncbi:hypothetical protein ACFLZS_01605 [Patescibacteria group bacterium]